MSPRIVLSAISRIRQAILAISLIVGCALATQAQAAHALQGKVITPDGTQPRTSVKVTLTLSGRRIYETFTDLSGSFSFTGLARGTYQLTAEGDGQTFETSTVYAEISGFGFAPQSFTQDIQLRRMRGTPAPRAGVVSGFSQVVPPAAKQALAQAMKLSAEGKSEAAIENMQQAVKIFPQYFEAHLQLGNEFLKLARYVEATSALDRAREISAKDERVYRTFGLVLMRQKNYPVAVAVFSEASRLNPTNAFNILMKATALIHQAYAVESWADKTPSDRQYILSRAELALMDAANLSDKKLKLDPLTSAMFYELKGQPSRAAEELEAYLRKTPTAKNAEAIKNEISRLRSKATKATP